MLRCELSEDAVQRLHLSTREGGSELLADMRGYCQTRTHDERHICTVDAESSKWVLIDKKERAKKKKSKTKLSRCGEISLHRTPPAR